MLKQKGDEEMKTEELIKQLKKVDACEEAIDWVGTKTPLEAWETCEQADWMLWFMAKMAGTAGWPTFQEVVRCAALCAETALPLVPKSELRPKAAIDAALAWVDNSTEVNRAVAKSAAAASSSAAYYASHASYVSKGIAYASHAASYAAHVIAYAAQDAFSASSHAASYAASYAAHATHAAARDTEAGKNHQKTMCQIIRANITIGAVNENNGQ